MTAYLFNFVEQVVRVTIGHHYLLQHHFHLYCTKSVQH